MSEQKMKKPDGSPKLLIGTIVLSVGMSFYTYQQWGGWTVPMVWLVGLVGYAVVDSVWEIYKEKRRGF